MQENVSLIREINELRREIKVMKHSQRQKELAGASPRGSGPKVDHAPGAPTNIVAAVQEIEVQKGEIQRLRQRIDELESGSTVAMRPISREKLPTMEGFHDPTTTEA